MNTSLTHHGRIGRTVGTVPLTVMLLCASSSMAMNFTLSDEVLMSFDTVYSSENAQLLGKTDIPGPGVQFEIHLTSNRFTFFYGIPLNDGVLSRSDYEAFDNFNLKFTYVDVVGELPDVSSAGLVGAGGSIGGAYVNPWIAPATRPTYTASIRTNAMGGREEWLGFNVTSWSPVYHSPAGSIVTLLIEADPFAVTLPEPNCLSLLGLGGLTAMMRRRARSGR